MQIYGDKRSGNRPIQNEKLRKGAQLVYELRAYFFVKKNQPKLNGSIQVGNGEPLYAYVEHGNFASRKFARSPPDERARYKLCLCISERRNRTHACYARRAAPTDNQNTPKAINDFRGILVSHSKPILNRKPPFDANSIPQNSPIFNHYLSIRSAFCMSCIRFCLSSVLLRAFFHFPKFTGRQSEF